MAVISGAASGMGRATAQLFADEGARLGILDINGEALEAVAGELRTVGAEVLPVSVDLALPASGFITGAVLVVDGGLTIRNA